MTQYDKSRLALLDGLYYPHAQGAELIDFVKELPGLFFQQMSMYEKDDEDHNHDDEDAHPRLVSRYADLSDGRGRVRSTLFHNPTATTECLVAGWPVVVYEDYALEYTLALIARHPSAQDILTALEAHPIIVHGSRQKVLAAMAKYLLENLPPTRHLEALAHMDFVFLEYVLGNISYKDLEPFFSAISTAHSLELALKDVLAQGYIIPRPLCASLLANQPPLRKSLFMALGATKPLPQPFTQNLAPLNPIGPSLHLGPRSKEAVALGKLTGYIHDKDFDASTSGPLIDILTDLLPALPWSVAFDLIQVWDPYIPHDSPLLPARGPLPEQLARRMIQSYPHLLSVQPPCPALAKALVAEIVWDTSRVNGPKEIPQDLLLKHLQPLNKSTRPPLDCPDFLEPEVIKLLLPYYPARELRTKTPPYALDQLWPNLGKATRDRLLKNRWTTHPGAIIDAVRQGVSVPLTMDEMKAEATQILTMGAVHPYGELDESDWEMLRWIVEPRETDISYEYFNRLPPF